MKKWKVLFWVLLCINVLTAVILLFIIFQPFNGHNPLNRLDSSQEYVEFSIETNKDDLNQIINHYLQNELSKQSVNYQVILEKDVELLGTINIFESEIKFNMSFVPVIQENGDLILKQKSMSLGMIQLPVQIVLNYVKKHYPLPKWVEIQPENQTVYVALQNMRMKSGYKIKVKKFDLENDDIHFILSVPLNNK